jgi:exonuclease VII large subunit
MNPIEDLWAKLVRRLRKRTKRSQYEAELYQVILRDEWRNLEQGYSLVADAQHVIIQLESTRSIDDIHM